MENPPPLAFETPKPQKKTSKSFKIFSESKKEYLVLFEISGNLLNISTELKNEESFQNIKYKNSYTLFEIQKVKYFNPYDSIEECLSEIDINKGIIKEENDKLNIVVPINSKKYPEITFTLMLKEKSESEKTNELYKIIHELNDKIKMLEKKIEDMSNNTIRIISVPKEPDGIILDFNAIKRDDFGKIIDEKNINQDFIYFKIIFNLKNDIDKDDKFFNNFKTFFGESKLFVKSDKKKVTLNGNYPIDNYKNKFDLLKYIFGTDEMGKLKISFKTDLKIKDILESEKVDTVFNKLTNCHFLLSGLSNNGKTAIINLLMNLNILAYTFQKDKNWQNPFNDILIPLILMLSWKELDLPLAKDFLNNIFATINYNYNDNLMKFYNRFRQLINSFFTLESFKKNLFLENINYEELNLTFILHYLKIGFDIKIKLNGINELIEEKVFKK